MSPWSWQASSVIVEELADVLSGLFGPVCYACIHVDPELRYPKGAARVTFATEAGFIAALKAKFVHLPHAGALKRVSSVTVFPVLTTSL